MRTQTHIHSKNFLCKLNRKFPYLSWEFNVILLTKISSQFAIFCLLVQCRQQSNPFKIDYNKPRSNKEEYFNQFLTRVEDPADRSPVFRMTSTQVLAGVSRWELYLQRQQQQQQQKKKKKKKEPFYFCCHHGVKWRTSYFFFSECLILLCNWLVHPTYPVMISTFRDTWRVRSLNTGRIQLTNWKILFVRGSTVRKLSQDPNGSVIKNPAVERQEFNTKYTLWLVVSW